tara:strand:+ start:28859 stop:28981 length:123 start_codon:yes stop_codon:yes gene_type:complete
VPFDVLYALGEEVYAALRCRLVKAAFTRVGVGVVSWQSAD